MNAFYDTLKGIERVMYKTAFNFHKQTVSSSDQAHQAGLNELVRLKKIKQRPVEKLVDITTGKFINHIKNKIC